MATINYFNIYSLNFSHLSDIKQQIALCQGPLCQDPLRFKLEEAFNKATKIKADIEVDKMQSQVLSMVIEMNPDNPGRPLFIKSLEEIQQTVLNRENLLEQFNGADPFAIQDLVHHILGISQSIESPFSEESRQQCFLLMKESGFLCTNYSSVNTKEDSPISYQPHLLASAYLEEHPGIQTLAIGCGEAGNTYKGSCHFRRTGDHVDRLFSIDLTAEMAPNLVVNMHDLDFWKGITDERFESIVDHTYGFFLFEDPNTPETVQHIYRTLKPGGYLEMDHSFDEKHSELLESVGFTMDINNTRIAIKF